MKSLCLVLLAAMAALGDEVDRMTGDAFLPDPLAGVKTREDWAQRRGEIRQQFEQWVFGTFPPPPNNLRAVVTGERKEGTLTVRDVRLEFGPGHRATLRVQVLIPPGKGPFPVFLTNHPRTRPWVATAVRRGYLGCIYFAADPIYGNADDSEGFRAVYPDATFSTIARWGWAGMRAVDYLVTLPEVDRARIAITGHSRNGKQALVAAAFDERITALALSSGNTGEGNPWRYTTDPFANESIQQITANFPTWFHPNLKLFAGREHKLPVDQNSLMALVAPRALLMASAYAEGQGAPFGFEQAYRSVRKVYRFLGAEDHIGLSLRAGEHPTVAEDIEKYVDFFDTAFARGKFERPETWVLGYDFDEWRKLSGESKSKPAGATLEDRLRWALGEEPPSAPFPNANKLGRVLTSEGWLAGLYNRPVKAEGMRHAPLAFGDDLKGDLYLPAQAKGRLPAVVWLHAHSHATGYSRYTRDLFRQFTSRGWAVLAFDQIGFGTRLHQATNFYPRYPHWSLMGKMVADTRAAVQALAALEEIDSSRIVLAGYALGGKVALFTAPSEPLVKGAAVLAAFTPLRDDRPEKETEGIRHYSHLHGLIPRFGFYLGDERSLPLDYPDLIRAIQPRKLLIIAPVKDRYANLEDVRKAAAGVQLKTPAGTNQWTSEHQARLVDWIASTF